MAEMDLELKHNKFKTVIFFVINAFQLAVLKHDDFGDWKLWQ